LEKNESQVVFHPSGRRTRIEPGRSVLDAAREAGESIESICGGKQTCGKCKVQVSGPVSPFSPQEAKFVTEKEKKDGYRLACATQIYGNVQAYLPEESRMTAPLIQKGFRQISCHLNPAVKRYSIALTPPTLQDPRGDFDRLQKTLTDEFGLRDLTIEPMLLSSLPKILRTNHWKVNVFVWMDQKVLDIRSAQNGEFYGLAIDIGTTTVALYLCNLEDGAIAAMDAMVNPQLKYGEDVMSRIAYAMTNPHTGLRDMQKVILDGLNGLVQAVCVAAKVPPEAILEATVVGNTAMHHIFLGIDPQNLGLAPFSPVIQSSLNVPARELGLKIHSAGNVHVLPIEAGFVGADNVGVLLAERPYAQDEMTLIIDVGTNGELILGNRQRLLSSSCATGPAFEGGHLQWGMRAAIGAIEKVRVDPDTFEVRFKTIGLEKWSDACAPGKIQARGICGSGIIDAVAEMVGAGILEKSGRFHPDLQNPLLRKTTKGYAFIIARAAETSMARDLVISAADVRALQLAKGAIYAGAKVMMNMLGAETVDRVILAGGFGSYIDSERAMRLGMFPDCDLGKVVSVGNAAGEGARIALFDRDKRTEADRLARQIEYVDLTTSPDFAREFIAAMPFPHMTDAFPHLPRRRTTDD
jgi:uncharacterized 2Fe-2S/4Fe-4S cluster protein (DUF4445 family)